ncbi:N-acetylmuramoyl-L-alanine amidase [Actinomycetospora sp. NBRC 106375]|uniref:N-acetylmuramoyl-L-alanine amidase n=1 Tax=Actinomycetospora sp. NBRC 106375 TaxID=3032207 RepID=UPI0024A5FE6C|nr:N-acetylmuramoyl-L-alanine amidase [Actinomycetospora sp. NBRC 106375]GLZ46859.1 N-acetylmuramoyl-L-alanine amidase [Actinomycetospora sp. NBRC 106375]
MRAAPLIVTGLLLVLAACGGAAPPPPPAAPTPQAREARAAPPTSPAPVVVLDPGHNGGNAAASDEIAREVPDGRGGTKPCNTTGTDTAGGYAEHAFAWDVAARVTRLLEAHGVAVRSTRPDDTGVGPCVDRRAEIANDARAALTVSIHADSGPRGGRGFHVALSDPALSASQGPPSAALGRALVAGLQAQGFETSTYRGEDGLDRRPDLAGLSLARVPAALVECANMADPADAARTEDPAGRQRYAEGLAAGILQVLNR